MGPRVSPKQTDMLLSFIVSYVDLARPPTEGDLKWKDQRWQETAFLFNQISDKTASPNKRWWKKCRDFWNDKMCDARRKDGKLVAALRKTGEDRASSVPGIGAQQLAGMDASRGTGGCRPSVIAAAVTLVSKLGRAFVPECPY